MPRLDSRLRCVASQIRTPKHADIGADHGHLIAALLSAGRIEHGIAIDNKAAPYANAVATLQPWIDNGQASVRHADGLDGLRDGEVNSVSICGMGGRSIQRIFNRSSQEPPRDLIIQPNDHIDEVRRWAWNHQYHLVDEIEPNDNGRFTVLRFQQRLQPDPIYAVLRSESEREVAFEVGPHFWRRFNDQWLARLRSEMEYWQRKPQLTNQAQKRLHAIEHVLSSKPP